MSASGDASIAGTGAVLATRLGRLTLRAGGALFIEPGRAVLVAVVFRPVDFRRFATDFARGALVSTLG